MEQSRLKAVLPFPSIRIQLLIISLVVLILPWIGVQTIRDMENLLREQQVHNLMSVAETVAKGLSSVSQLVSAHNQSTQQTPENSEIILTSTDYLINLDGYADDWPNRRIRQTYDSTNALQDGNNNTHISFALSGTLQNGKLLLLLDVNDDVLYQTTNPETRPHDGDHLLLGIGNARAEIVRKFILSSNSPGWLSVMPLDESEGRENRIQAELKTRTGGYTIELAIPLYLAGRYLSLQLYDRDNNDHSFYSVIGNTPLVPAMAGYVFEPYLELNEIIQRYRIPSQKITVLDKRGYILASNGSSLPPESTEQLSQDNILDRFQQILILADSVVSNEAVSRYKMQQQYVNNALQNQSGHEFTRDESGRGLLSVAVPLSIDNQPNGALVIQQSTEAITGVRYRALIKIMITSLSAIAIIAIVLLLYATILIKRVRSLNNQLQTSVSDDGRLKLHMTPSVLGDEIGELSRGISSMVDRLQAYQHYLESMASKLSHELRTPLSVVQSSLENLRLGKQSLDDDPSLARADEGLSRLKMILSNLSEASRLENALKVNESEAFDLPTVVEGCVNGYRQAFADVEFDYQSNIESCRLLGSPELIAQLMDKLISNAVDFHQPETPITVSITHTRSGCRLGVMNRGETIPENIISTLFDSMVSARKATTDTPHLGLGLYIVRLIAKYHGGVPGISSDNGETRVYIDFNNEPNA